METDFAKIGRPDVLHQAFRGLDKVNDDGGYGGVIACSGSKKIRRRVALFSSEESPSIGGGCVFAESVRSWFARRLEFY